MLALSNMLSKLFAVVMSLFVTHPMTGMIVISVLTGVLVLIVYKYTSNQKAISRAKDRIKANFLAIMLFPDSLRVLLKSIGKILAWNLDYLTRNLKPLLVMIVPVMLLFVQLNFWYGYRPIGVGEQALVHVQVAEQVDLAVTKVSMDASDGVVAETPGIRAPLTGQITWRIRGKSAGEHLVNIRVGDQVETKRIVVGAKLPLHRLAPLRHDGNFVDGLFYPGEPKLAGDIRMIQVDYPMAEMDLFGWKLHWVIIYLIFSLLAGLSMKGVFKVDI